MLKEKIISISLLSALLPVIIISLVIIIQKSVVTSNVKNDMDSLIESKLSQIAKDVYGLLENSNNLLQQQVNSSLLVSNDIFKRRGGTSFSNETVNWKAINQFTREEKNINLPKMLLGGNWFGQVNNMKQYVQLVDDVKRLVGGTCTIFQRINEEGDMLRVATNVENLDGTRAISTFIPAINPDGTPNAVVSTVLKGETYRGNAFVVNAWYVSAYEPIFDNTGKIIGMLYVGVKQESVESLRNTIINIKAGESGHVSIIGGNGIQKGKFIITKNEADKDRDLWEVEDAEGNKFIQNIVNNSVKLQSNNVIFENYLWKHSNDKEAKKYKVALAYFQPWDWIISVNILEDDYNKIEENISSTLNNLLFWSIGFALIVLVITTFLSFRLSTKISEPIEFLSRIADNISEGNLLKADEEIKKANLFNSRLSINNKYINKYINNAEDETLKLFKSFKTMISGLKSLVTQVKESSIQIISTSTELAATSKQQSESINNFNASTSQVAAATKEINATSKELAETIKEVADVTVKTEEIAGSSKQELNEMESSLQFLLNSSRSISEQLNIINNKAKTINSIVITITQVADQTNLLSLNASIEAEKAGKYGLGFSIVAKEIRRLADQTAVSTLDIEKMVQDMQSSVSQGVNDMKNFNIDMEKGVEKVNIVIKRLEEIIESVQNISSKFENAGEGMNAQLEATNQITASVQHLSISASQTASSLKELNKAAVSLNSAINDLKNEISNFNV